MRLGFFVGLLFAPLMANAGEQGYEVKVDGMTCASCVEKVTKALQDVPNVAGDSVKVVLKEKKAHLTFKNDDPETVEAVKSAVKKAGFTVTGVRAPKAVAPAKKL